MSVLGRESNSNGQGVGMHSMDEYGLLKYFREGSRIGLARTWGQLYNGDDSLVGTRKDWKLAS